MNEKIIESNSAWNITDCNFFASSKKAGNACSVVLQCLPNKLSRSILIPLEIWVIISFITMSVSNLSSEKNHSKEYVCLAEIQKYCKYKKTGYYRFKCLKNKYKKLGSVCKRRIQLKIETCKVRPHECKPNYLNKFF